MNLAQLLMTGPKLRAAPSVIPKPPRKHRSHVTHRGIKKYKSKAEEGTTYSTQVAARLGINVATATKQLKAYYDAGLLEKIGTAESKSQNKPILYRWK